MGAKFNLQLISGGTEQNFKNKVKALTGAKQSQHRWIWYMDYLKWYTNFFQFIGDDELERIKPSIVEKQYWNGVCAILKMGDKKIPVNVRNIELDMYGYVSKGIVQSTFEEIDGIELNETNAVFLQSNFYRFPLFMGLDIYLEPLINLFETVEPELKNAITKVLFKIDMKDGKSIDKVEQLIKDMTTRDKSLIGFISNELGEHIELKTETITDDIQGAIKFYINYAYSRTGRLYNASEKDERNLTSEVSTNQLQFAAIRDDMVMYLKDFIIKYNALFGTSVEVKLLQDLENEKQMELQKVMSNQLGGNENEGDDDNEKSKPKPKK